MTTLLGLPINATLKYSKKNGAACYDPDKKVITITTGFWSRLMRSICGRSLEWAVAHEKAHALLEEKRANLTSKLSKTLGDLSEGAYQASGWKEVFRLLVGAYDRELFVSARASLCPEEDFAECCAYLQTHNRSIQPLLPFAVKLKLQVVNEAMK
jgi:hypothetical protein